MSPETEHTGQKAASDVDPEVGYARGDILSSSVDEAARLVHAKRIARDRLRHSGIEGLYDFTGSPCDFPLLPEDEGLAIREFASMVRVSDELNRTALQHMGGRPSDASAVFNRTSAGIVAAILALTEPNQDLVALTPGVPSHPSIKRAAALAKNSLKEVREPERMREAIEQSSGRMVVVTGVSSELATLTSNAFRDGIHSAHQAGRIILVDDAYGARVRTLLMGQDTALACGADLAITSIQKAGLGGPRAGLLVGDQALVAAVIAKGSELGLEARGPLTLAVTRALQRFEPERLYSEVRAGEYLYKAMAQVFGDGNVEKTLLGPAISEVRVFEHVAQSTDDSIEIVPAEVSAALGMLLLKYYGLVTVNAIGMPGARASLRLKASEDELERFGGSQAVSAALEDVLARLARIAADTDAIRDVLLGTE
jgi:L-seryl-tRNA(Ser) seleniumtransferase